MPSSRRDAPNFPEHDSSRKLHVPLKDQTNIEHLAMYYVLLQSQYHVWTVGLSKGRRILKMLDLATIDAHTAYRRAFGIYIYAYYTLCVYIHVHDAGTHMHTHAYIYIYTGLHIYIYTYAHTYTYIYSMISAYRCVYILLRARPFRHSHPGIFHLPSSSELGPFEAWSLSPSPLARGYEYNIVYSICYIRCVMFYCTRYYRLETARTHGCTTFIYRHICVYIYIYVFI